MKNQRHLWNTVYKSDYFIELYVGGNCYVTARGICVIFKEI